MKKTALAFMLLFALLLTSCGAPAPLTTAEPEPAPAADAAAQTASEPESEKAPPQLVMRRMTDWRQSEESYMTLAYSELAQLSCGSSDGWSETITPDEHYPALVRALEAYNAETAEEIRAQVDNLARLAAEDVQSGSFPGLNEPGYAYFLRRTASVERCDSRVLSVLFDESGEAGGVHGSHGTVALNLDSESGARLTLRDVLTPEGYARFPELFAKLLDEQNPGFTETQLVESISDTIRSEAEEGTLCFTLDAHGLSVHISPYELCSYAAGCADVRIEFASDPTLFAERYATAGESSVRALRAFDSAHGVQRMPVYTDGGKRTLELRYSPWNTRTGEAGQFTLSLGSEELSLGELYCYDPTGYLLHSGGRDLLLLSFSWDNDWQETRVFDLNGKNITQLQDLWVAPGQNVPTNAEDFVMSSRSNLLSTYGIVRRYRVGSEGAEPLEALFRAVGAPTLTARAELPALLVAQSADTVGEPAMLQTGASYTIAYTDNERAVVLQSTDGRLYRVDVDRENFSVSGIGFEEAFDGTIFVG